MAPHDEDTDNEDEYIEEEHYEFPPKVHYERDTKGHEIKIDFVCKTLSFIPRPYSHYDEDTFSLESKDAVCNLMAAICFVHSIDKSNRLYPLLLKVDVSGTHAPTSDEYYYLVDSRCNNRVIVSTQSKEMSFLYPDKEYSIEDPIDAAKLIVALARVHGWPVDSILSILQVKGIVNPLRCDHISLIDIASYVHTLKKVKNPELQKSAELFTKKILDTIKKDIFIRPNVCLHCGTILPSPDYGEIRIA